MSELPKEVFEEDKSGSNNRQLSLVALSALASESPLSFDPALAASWHKQIASRTVGDYLSDPEHATPEQLTDETIAVLALYVSARSRSKLQGLESTLDQLMMSLEEGVAAATEKYQVSKMTVYNKRVQIATKIATELDRVVGGIEPEVPIRAPRQRATMPKSEAPRQRASRAGVSDRDDVGMYFNDISKVPLLNAEREVELSKTIEAGLMAEHLLETGRVGRRRGGAPMNASEEELKWLAEEGRRAFDTFITSNLRLVVSLAKKYTKSGMPLLDLIQEGNTGLIRGVEKFDYQKGYKFSTYATWWIRQAINRGIANRARVVRLPAHVVEEIKQLRAATRELEKRGREPEPEEIAKELEMDVGRVLELMDWKREHTSLDTPVGEGEDATLGDLVATETAPGPEQEVIAKSEREWLEKLVEKLNNDRLIDVIRGRYGMIDGREQTLEEIGDRHGVTKERIRQLEAEAIAKLRRLAERDNEEFTA